MWIDSFSALSLSYFPLNAGLTLLSSVTLSPPPPGCPSFLPQIKILTKGWESEHHLAFSSGAPMASESEGEPELCSSFSSVRPYWLTQ